MRSLDIVVPTYNRARRIPALVNALARQCRSCDTIIVVWQGQSLNRSGLPENTVHLHAPAPNLPAARNCGIRVSRADIVLFLDDDSIPADGLIEAHRSCYVSGAIAGVAGYVDDPLFDRARPVPSYIDLTKGECVQNFSLPVSGTTASVMGANMSFRRDVLIAAGGFDERFGHNALWEEVDLCLRLLAQGHSLWYCAEAKVVHEREADGGCRDQKKYRYLYHEFANTAYFASRFAQLRHYPAWLIFWKHRLEYRARKKVGGHTIHDPRAVLAGIAGAMAGTARYWRTRALPAKKIPAVNKTAVYDALSTLRTAVAP